MDLNFWEENSLFMEKVDEKVISRLLTFQKNFGGGEKSKIYIYPCSDLKNFVSAPNSLLSPGDFCPNVKIVMVLAICNIYTLREYLK